MVHALYRRYRPDTFADVVGQEHVTGPLIQALRNNRIHHAYLFSGPRGCGKTTSARILARCLNCAKGPTPEPCGSCDSCVALSREGGGSLDVIEIDAASHGGVDDARELREKAFFAPAASRFKIYIIDEAHMVSREGFNALLKLVEEPPDHVKFVFATTEPEKVIGTIRSRTHHYPFRLIAPKVLQDYLATICEREGVTVERGVLPLVVRAGRGSARDSLSVLDQLVAGAGEGGVTYAGATALLGFTDAALLDDVVDAFAAADAAAVFGLVDRVIEGGHDPRRFAEDLLERFRDLIVLAAVPDAAAAILGEPPEDQLERMRAQAARFGSAELSRAADLVSAGLTEMRGATAPRLQLELICARVLLPGADREQSGLLARLDRLERRLAIEEGGTSAALASAASASAAPASAASASAAPASAAPAGRQGSRRGGASPAKTPDRAGSSADRPAERPPAAEPDAVPAASAAEVATQPARPEAASAVPGELGAEPAAEAGAEPSAGPARGADDRSGVDVIGLRRQWPEVLDRIARLRRATWTLVSHNAQVAEVSESRVVLAIATAGLRDTFLRGGHEEIVRQALIDVLGLGAKVEAIVDPSARGDAGTPAGGRRAGPAVDPAPVVGAAAADDEPSSDDPDADDSGLSHQELLERQLGAKVIGEYDHR